jgi:hypothetical protein
LDALLKIGIGADDSWCLASELQDDGLEVFPGNRSENTSHSGRSSEAEAGEERSARCHRRSVGREVGYLIFPTAG